MALPVNVPELLHGKTVEWERLEFKEGFNDEAILHSICAFANDLHNWGGGYIFVGIAEKDGRPVLPPKGLKSEQVDAVQKKVRELCYRLDPHYFPVMQPETIKGELVLAIWVPSGDQRPYSAPVSLAKENKQREYYIRQGAASVAAKGSRLVNLLEQAKRVPYDERINHDAALSDLDFGCMRTYLQEVGSRLFEESARMPFEELCRQMRISGGPVEHERPLNLGLMLFSKKPEAWFPNARIELVVHGSAGRKGFDEKSFGGPVQDALRSALDYIRSQVIRERVIKSPGRPEADRVFNFPFPAVEEALANAVFHKDYGLGKPIEVQVFPGEQMTILSYPGPLPPISPKDLQKKRLVARDYRNRRLGDFLKELHLTEGRGTGVPLIHSSMAANGSPVPVLETDNDRSYFLVTLPVHPAFEGAEMDFLSIPEVHDWEEVQDLVRQLAAQVSPDPADAKINGHVDAQVSAQVSAQVNAQVSAQVGAQVGAQVYDQDIVKDLLDFLRKSSRNREDLLARIHLVNHRANYLRWIYPLMANHWVRFTLPDKPTSSKQEYELTIHGLVLYHILKQANG